MKTIHIIVIAIIAAVLGAPKPLPAQVPGDATALQGLRGNTLVAGKSTAFRLFTNDSTYSAANRVEATIIRPDGSQLIQSRPQGDFAAIPTNKGGRPSSLVVRVLGKDLPWVGNYKFTAKVFNAVGTLLASYSIDQFQLLPTKDLIAAIDRVHADSVNPGTPAEIQAARDALQRLAAIWPIRDGISTPDGDRNAGLRYVINNNPQPYGCNGNPRVSDCQLCPFFASMINRSTGLDVMNLGIAYRFQDPGEGAGGTGPHHCENQQVGYASVVMSGALAPGFGQETGHVFTLEPPNDPHFDSTIQAGHSKDTTIDPPDADLGFDVQMNQPFASPMFDVMHQEVCSCPNNEVSYNSWDWEYLRQQFVKLSSTGPSSPAHFMTDTAPAAAGVGTSVYFFGKRVDGRIFYNRAVVGQAGQGWIEMEGNGHTDAAPAAAAVGTHVFVAVKGLDGRIYVNQADEGKSFGQWFPMDFRTDVAPCLAAVSDRIFIFAKGLNQHIYVSQAVLRHPFSGWFEVQGDGRTDSAPAAASVASHLFVVAKSLDGSLFLNQADLGRPFGAWVPMTFSTDVAAAVAGVENNVYFLAKKADGRIFYNRAVLGEGGQGWKEMEGNGRSDAAPAAAAVGGHLFVAAKGPGGLIHINQTDLGKPFGEWFP